MTRRVAVLLGGRSGEHEVSIRSARSVIAALDRQRWEPVPVGVTRRGRWLGAEETVRALESGAPAFEGGGQPVLAAAGCLAECDAAFPLIHGTYGEDGTLQGFLEIAGLPYAGCGVAASAIGMDKALMKALFREAGIRQPRYAVLRSWEVAEDPVRARQYVGEVVGYPAFVKPANGGSSVGVTKSRSNEDLDAAFRSAFAYDDKAVVEEAIEGQEVECSVIGNERPEASIVGEIIPDREFYDYESKYSATSGTELAIPARIDAPTAAAVREMALRMYRVMGCEGYARVDFFVTKAGEVLANEVNTIPGFTSISMFPKLWEASGLPYPDLLSRILELAFERHARRGNL
jgi:D-alanine-D-alanine ligase